MIYLRSSRSSEEVVGTLQAMRIQEEKTYSCKACSYMASSAMLFVCSNDNAPVDESCRTRMVEWCFQIVDLCKFSRETVAIATNLLDRYTLRSPDIMIDRKLFQLAFMTCLYTAIKVHESKAMEPRTVSNLSRGIFTEQNVVSMERKILAALTWNVHPPTAISFVHMFLEIVPEDILSNSDRCKIVKLSELQTEYAVKNHQLMAYKTSTIALAALSKALEFVMPTPCCVDSIMHIVVQTAQMHYEQIDLWKVEERLLLGLESNPVWPLSKRGHVHMSSKHMISSSNGRTGSPRSVCLHVSNTSSQA